MDRYATESLAEEIILEASVLTLFDNYMAPAMESIGKKWEEGYASLAQVYMSGRVCEGIAEKFVKNDGAEHRIAGKISITTLNDFHILGKRVVSAFLSGVGFPLEDYGRTTVDELMTRVKQDTPDILLISALMLPSALQVEQITRFIKDEKLPVITIVGGAPFRFDPDLWREVGADATGNNAGEAITLVRTYLSEGRA
jgi:methanogenic corrinoid protein MtbC1